MGGFQRIHAFGQRGDITGRCCRLRLENISGHRRYRRRNRFAIGALPHDRMERVGGDFFKNAPANADAYTMRWIIHDWPDQQAAAILGTVRRAMKPESRLVLIEEIVPETPESSWAKWLDLHMLAVAGGRERTATEYKELYASAGFDLERTIPTGAGSSLIIGRPRR
jgi:O-methyltransferase domain